MDTVGVGRSLDTVAEARTVALAEAAERYAGKEEADGSSAYRWARAADLDGVRLDSRRLPRCSAFEYANPACPLSPFDEAAVIRWSSGAELCSDQSIWVPSALCVYGLHRRVPGERFCLSISTGYAVHTDPDKALCSAICEVIERDIIEVLWAHRLTLPRIDPDLLTESSRRILQWAADHFVRTFLLDATSDMGVPTAYCLQVAEYDPPARHLVSCATGASLASAAEKALVDAVGHRDNMPRDERSLKLDYRNFTTVSDGARFMARAELAPAFDFLIQDYEDRPTAGQPDLPKDPEDQLAWLTGALRAKGMQAIAVDRTGSELSRVGLTAVSVVIPDLQPMSLHPLARYRAHPRLYMAPILMGYRALPEAELNPWPQPFA